MSTHNQTLQSAVLKESPADDWWRRVLRILGKLRYLFLPLLVCWHRKMSRPFTRNGETYRVCLRCGMRREFDLKQWKSKGAYYNIRERQPLHESKSRLHLVEGSKGKTSRP